MKRLSLLVLFFFCCSFVQPYQARSAFPLALLVPATVGATVLAVSGTYYALQSPSSHSFDGHTITSAMWKYRPVTMAGTQLLLGNAVTGVLDLARAVREGALSAYSSLQGIYDDFWGGVSAPSTWEPGDVVQFPGSPLKVKLGEPFSSNAYQTLEGFNSIYVKIVPGSNPELHAYGSGTFAYLDLSNSHPTIPGAFLRMIVPYTTTTDPVDYPGETAPTEWDDSMAPQLAAHINQGLQAGDAGSVAVGTDLVNLQKDRPGLWAYSDTSVLPESPNDISDYPPAQPVTQADLENWAQTKGATAQQDYIDILEDLVAANPTNADLAAQLAQAQAQQAQQEADDVKDSYNPITDNPFSEPYNPGSFDIPARFTTFLNNVKSTGLFSFSSSFFNSLPGGGSPIYTVEAGTYGTHTIDLSETMSTGLAVLKTVLLLLFGFLSIRVVILKR